MGRVPRGALGVALLRYPAAEGDTGLLRGNERTVHVDRHGVEAALGADAATAGETDWRDPLAVRVLRFWPWPHGAQAKDVHLDETAAASPEGLAAQAAARFEALRLLYVGATRARDYLVLVDGARGLAWLDELRHRHPHVAPERHGLSTPVWSWTFAGLALDASGGARCW